MGGVCCLPLAISECSECSWLHTCTRRKSHSFVHLYLAMHESGFMKMHVLF